MAERRPYTEPFGQFCEALNRFGVDYVVIGSEAVAFHGIPRFSLDFDIVVRPATILLHISGIDYHVASADAVMGAYGAVPVRFLWRTALIANKRASGRPKDLADVDLLTSDDPEHR